MKKAAGGWDVYFQPGFCGGLIQPGFVVRWGGRWYRTKNRTNPTDRTDVLSAHDASVITLTLPRLEFGNSKFHEYLTRSGKKWSDVPLLSKRQLPKLESE